MKKAQHVNLPPLGGYKGRTAACIDIVTGREYAWRCEVNLELVQQAQTGQALFTIYEYYAKVSGCFALET
jgi:hypothetical protein